jgi:hypothetical protein
MLGDRGLPELDDVVEVRGKDSRPVPLRDEGTREPGSSPSDATEIAPMLLLRISSGLNSAMAHNY